MREYRPVPALAFTACAASAVRGAIAEGKKPGNALDTLSKMTRQAPLGMLLAAFLIGRYVARHR
jgi:hypothetical protein